MRNLTLQHACECTLQFHRMLCHIMQSHTSLLAQAFGQEHAADDAANLTNALYGYEVTPFHEPLTL